MSEMSKTAKSEYIREKSRDYARALSRGEKHAIVQEVARTCAFSVKYVIRRLNAPLTAGASGASAALHAGGRRVAEADLAGERFSLREASRVRDSVDFGEPGPGGRRGSCTHAGAA